MTSSAPSVSSFSALLALDVVAITRAPNILANCTAKIETPPVHCVNTVQPARIGAPSVSADHAVRAAHGSVEASSNER